MADDATNPRRGGVYGGGTYVSPFFFGGGAYLDQYGNLYPQFAVGTPGLSTSVGAATDLDKSLTGASVYAGAGGINVGWNPDSTALEVSEGKPAFNFRTPSVGATYGFGPFNLLKLPSLLYPNGVDPATFNGLANIGQ